MAPKWLSFSIFLVVFSTLPAFEVASVKSDKKLRYEDASYEEEIRTVLLYPDKGYPGNVFDSPVDVTGRNSLVLEFDDLVESHEQYRVKIINCTKDWKKSSLKTLDYLYDFNEFNITRFEYSTATKIGYIHYRFKVPDIKLAGNYLLIAYRGSDEKDIVLSRRFMIYRQAVDVVVLSGITGMTSMKRTNQQLDFKLTYEGNPFINPLENIDVVLRQNQQWHNAIKGLKPSFFREGLLEYRYFNFENNFSGGNEYRLFDMRSLLYPGQNVRKIDLTKRPSVAYLMKDRPRIYKAYNQYDDINGNFYVANVDTGERIEADYLYTQFSLDYDVPIGGDIYVTGKMNDYATDDRTRMRYDKTTGTYSNTQLLKQGFYNYKYLVKSDTLSNNYLEGNRFETENDYEIFVYYSPPNLRSDLLIAYKQVTLNPRD